MKMLTLNAHSLLEEDYGQKLVHFLEFILREQPDLIALQEVNQSESAPEADGAFLKGLVNLPGENVPVRSNNHAAWIAYVLHQAGIPCQWVWLAIKRGYGRFDEGTAMIALHGKIAEAAVHPLSRSDDYMNWRTRKALGVRLEGGEDWYYSIHMGWWDDLEEPFLHQWKTLCKSVDERKARAPVWLMGDFNSPAEIRGEGYDCIRASGWQDTWLLAGERRGGPTVPGDIDGWRDERNVFRQQKGLRMDHIWCSQVLPVRSAKVIFDGTHEPQVSDHFGLMLETAGLPHPIQRRNMSV